MTALMYASLVISLLAAFVAMLGKQWLNRYLRNAGGSMIERCGDRQRKCDGLKKWPFHFFVESLPVMLQAALLLLACGLCKHMSSINTPVAGVLITLTVFGVVFYLGIVIVGASSYECPFQTPVSTAVRGIWKTTKPHVTATLHSTVISATLLWLPVSTTLRWSWEMTQCQILHFALWLPPTIEWLQSRHQTLPIVQPTPQQPSSWLPSLHNLSEDIQCRILRAALHLLQTQPSSPRTILPTSPWLTPTALVTLRNMNAGDVRCISWILWNITDPEALDAAVRLAGMVRWFEDGLDVEPPYDQLVSMLKGCFDSAGRVYPGSRNRAYHSARAALWIRIRALYVSREFVKRFPLPTVACDMTSLDPDLRCLLRLYRRPDFRHQFLYMYRTDIEVTHECSQWTSNALLCLSWAMQSEPSTFGILSKLYWNPASNSLPLNAVLNRLLVSCIFLGLPAEEGVLRIQDKRYCFPFLCLFHCSSICLLVISLIRFYPSSPKQQLKPSALLASNLINSESCKMTYEIQRCEPDS